MALQLAGMLEAVASREDWTVSVLKSMNSALDSLIVSPGYNLMVTIAGRSYLFISDAKGKLQVSMPGPGKQTMNALSRAAVRIILDFDAFKDYDSTAASWTADMVDKRKLRFEGDTQLLETFESDIGPKISSVQSSVDAGGPGEAAVAKARAELLGSFDDMKSQNKEAWELELTQSRMDDIVEWLDVEYECDRQPAFMGYWGHLFFSAMSSFSGNMGQANYCAANMIKDVMTFNIRINCRLNDLPMTMMWGAVAGIGMRWKAFASQDMLNTDSKFAEMRVDWEEAQKGLGYILRGFAPEWTTCAIVPKEWITASPARHPDPWGFAKLGGKGKGGGLSFDNDDSISEAYDKGSQQMMGRTSWLSPGRRVKICGLTKSPEMNGMKCTLVEEIDDEKWQVRLDGDLGDKIIKVMNLSGYSDKCITTEDYSTLDICIAGTWSDWVPQDMIWDAEAKCHMVEIEVEQCPAGFGISQSKAGSIAWKNRTAVREIRYPGKYQIKLFCKDGKILHHLEVNRVGDVEVKVPQAELDAFALRLALQSVRPDWSDKELTSVQEKLAKVEINTVSDLVDTVGIKPKKNGLNKRLKEVGEKLFSEGTISAFREYAKSSA